MREAAGLECALARLGCWHVHDARYVGLLPTPLSIHLQETNHRVAVKIVKRKGLSAEAEKHLKLEVGR